MFNWLALLLAWWPRKRVYTKGELYFTRFYLTPSSIFGWRLPRRVFLHCIYRKDTDRYPHDHPFDFWTWVVRGGYLEAVYLKGREIGRRAVGAFADGGHRLLWRHHTHTHKILALAGDRPVWTLVVATPLDVPWGFWTENNVWIPAEEYLAGDDQEGGP